LKAGHEQPAHTFAPSLIASNPRPILHRHIALPAHKIGEMRLGFGSHDWPAARIAAANSFFVSCQIRFLRTRLDCKSRRRRSVDPQTPPAR
jgi:hypothetical protein